MTQFRKRNFSFIMIFISCALILTGCNRCFLKTSPTPGMHRDKNNIPQLDDNQRIKPMYIGVLEAQEWVGELSDAYLRASRAERTKRVFLDTTLIATAMTALHKIVIKESTTSAGNLAIFGTGISLLSQRVINPMHKEIYAEGARALNCIYSAVNGVPAEYLLTNLQEAMFKQHSATVKFNNLKNGETDNDKQAQISQTVLKAEKLYRVANSILTSVDPRGREIIARAKDIHIAVEEELNRFEPQPLRFNEALQKAVNMAGSSNMINTSVFIVPNKEESVSKLFSDTSATAKPALRTAETELNNANEELIEAIAKLNQAGTFNIPALNFTSCSFAVRAPARSLQLSRKIIELKSESQPIKGNYEFEIGITGGQPRYEVREELLDKKRISTKILNNSAIPTLRVMLDLSKPDLGLNFKQQLVVIIKDAANQEQVLLIKAVKKEPTDGS